jgi:hypothetical protein
MCRELCDTTAAVSLLNTARELLRPAVVSTEQIVDDFGVRIEQRFLGPSENCLGFSQPT